MKPKTMILMVIAVVCGLGASYMTSKLLAKREKKVEAKVNVVVATKAVPKFRTLKKPEKYFAIKQMPKSAVPRKFFSNLKDVKDKVLKHELTADKVLSQEDILMGSYKPIKIPDGKYAIAISVNATKMVGFFVFPGDEVDFLLTQYRAGAMASIILRKVMVLAAGGTTSPTNPGKTQTIQARTVTVAVTSEEAQLLRLAEKKGELSLVLRDSEDKDTSPVKPMTDADLFQANKKTERPTKEPVESTDPKPDTKPVAKLEPIKDPPKEETKFVERKIKADWDLVIEGSSREKFFFHKGKNGEHTIDKNAYRTVVEKQTVTTDPKDTVKKD